MSKQRNAILLGSALLAATGVANATTFNLQFNSNGGYAADGTTVLVVESVTSPGSDLSTAPVAGVSYEYSQPVYSGASSYAMGGSGIVDLKDGVSSIHFTFSGSVAADGQSTEENVLNFSGGTGVLAGYSGTGNLSSITGSSVLLGGPSYSPSDYSLTSFTAQLQSVPEPTSVAALALGAGLLLRRRAVR